MRAALAFALCILGVCAHAAPASFLIEAELEEARIYVGGETILRLRLLRAPGVPYGMLRPPALGDAADLWSLGPVRWFQAEREGASWDVHERAYLIVPRRGGRLVVPGVDVEGPLRKQAHPREARALRGPQLELNVRPAPEAAREPWLPARSLTLEESWSRDPAGLSAGTAVTRTIILRAEGLPGPRLPQLEMAAQPALRVHHDWPERGTEHRTTGTIGRLIQRIVLVPLDEGEVLLPELSVHWWDVAADTPRTATLPARTLRLQAAAAPTHPAAEAPTVLSLPVRAMAVVLVLLLLAALWWGVRKEPLRDARKQLRAACRANDPRAARDALVLWWKAAAPGASPQVLQRIGLSWDTLAQAQLASLDAALYGRRAWNGAEFWRTVRPRLRNRAARRNAPSGSPPPFFRLQESER